MTHREEQIMEVIYGLGSTTIAQIQRELKTRLGYATIRSQLKSLESKGMLHRHSRGRCYVYSPARSKEQTREAALHDLLQSHFEGSADSLLITLAHLCERPELIPDSVRGSSPKKTASS